MFHRYLFIGTGFRYNHIYNTEIERGGLIAANRSGGFDVSTSVGAELAVLHDGSSNFLNGTIRMVLRIDAWSI
jgi:hypothetical protein